MWNISEIDIPYCIFFFESQGVKSLLYSFNICFYELQLQLAHFHTSRFFWKQKRRKRKKKNSSHFSYVQLFGTPWTAARQAPLSIGLPRQEYWRGLPFPSPGNPPTPGIEPGSPVTPASAEAQEVNANVVREAAGCPESPSLAGVISAWNIHTVLSHREEMNGCGWQVFTCSLDVSEYCK